MLDQYIHEIQSLQILKYKNTTHNSLASSTIIDPIQSVFHFPYSLVEVVDTCIVCGSTPTYILRCYILQTLGYFT